MQLPRKRSRPFIRGSFDAGFTSKGMASSSSTKLDPTTIASSDFLCFPKQHSSSKQPSNHPVQAQVTHFDSIGYREIILSTSKTVSSSSIDFQPYTWSATTHFHPIFPSNPPSKLPKMASKATAAADNEPVDVLFALHEKFNVLDFAGPLEVLSSALHDINNQSMKFNSLGASFVRCFFCYCLLTHAVLLL